MKDPRVFLFEISAFRDEVILFTDGLSAEVFESDAKTQRAVSYCLLSIGEAVKRLNDEHDGFLTNEVSSELPWQDIIGMRHFLAHGYDRIDPLTLFEVSMTDVPTLRDAVAVVLSKGSLQDE